MLTKLQCEFLRFITVGLLSTAVNYGVFGGLYELLGFYYLVASSIGFVLGVSVGYPLNKYWTFGTKKKKAIEKNNDLDWFKYLAVYICSLAIGQVFLYMAVEALEIAVLLANLVMICITTMTNFIGVKLWVFYSR